MEKDTRDGRAKIVIHYRDIDLELSREAEKKAEQRKGRKLNLLSAHLNPQFKCIPV